MGFGKHDKKVPPGQEKKIAEGLKEALNVGTENAVSLTGTTDGFFKNETIKILMPKELKGMENGLRKIGREKEIENFVLSMNRAAEQAAPFAKEIFLGAIREMTFEDAVKIFRGSDTAATDYFKEKTTPKLVEAFTPSVNKATDEVGVTRQYKSLAKQASSITFVKIEMIDIDQYVVTKTLDGLFHMVGEEERKIRKDPVARVTKLLKDVFGD